MNFKSYYASYIEDYIKLKGFTNYKFNTDIKELIRFDNFLYEENIKQINGEIIDKWVSNNPNWSINSKARSISAIKGLCIYLRNNGIIDYVFNKMGYKSKRIYQPYIFSHEQIKAIVYYADNYYSRQYFEMKYIMSFLIRLLYGTGMRLGEALAIEKKNIDFEEGIIKLVNTKNNSDRLVILTDDLTNRLNEYVRKMNRDTKYLFYNMHGEKIEQSVIQKAFYRILNKSGIKRTDKGPRLHDLRFTFITHSFNKHIKTGKDARSYLLVLMTYVGHSCIKSLEYYIKSTDETLDLVRIATEEYMEDNNEE